MGLATVRGDAGQAVTSTPEVRGRFTVSYVERVHRLQTSTIRPNSYLVAQGLAACSAQRKSLSDSIQNTPRRWGHEATRKLKDDYLGCIHASSANSPDFERYHYKNNAHGRRTFGQSNLHLLPPYAIMGIVWSTLLISGEMPRMSCHSQHNAMNIT